VFVGLLCALCVVAVGCWFHVVVFGYVVCEWGLSHAI
jgi:hypothetical protein